MKKTLSIIVVVFLGLVGLSDWTWDGSKFYAQFSDIQWVWNGTRYVGTLGSPSTNDTSLRAWWTMDAITNDNQIVDFSGNGHTLTLVDGPSIVAGKVGNALSLNGTTQYGTTQDASDWPKNGDWTIAAWISAYSSWGTTMYIVGSGDATFCFPHDLFLLGADSGSFNGTPQTESYKLYKADAYARASGYNLYDGNWHHVAGVRSNSVLSIWVDGTNRTVVGGGTTGTFTNPDPIVIGVTYNFANPFKGLIDDVRIYNRALSSAEILALANP